MTMQYKLMRKSPLNGVEMELIAFDTYEEAAEELLGAMDDWVANIDKHSDDIHGGDEDQMLTTESIVRAFKKQYYVDGPVKSMIGVEWDPEEGNLKDSSLKMVNDLLMI